MAVRVVDLADVRVGDDDERQQLQVHEPACEALWELALRLARRGEEEFSRGVEQGRAADLEHLLERQLLGGLEGVLLHRRVVKAFPGTPTVSGSVTPHGSSSIDGIRRRSESAAAGARGKGRRLPKAKV